MSPQESTVELLGQIRDLLAPISGYYGPMFEESVRKLREDQAARLPGLVQGKASRAACVLLNGSLTQSQICQRAKMDASNLSKLVRRLDDAGMLTDGSDPKKPQMVFSSTELRQIFGDTNG